MCCSSFTLSHYLLWCNQAPVWVTGMRPGQGDRPKVMISLWPWRAALPLRYRVSALSQVQADLIPFICCFEDFFSLAVLARSCTLISILSPVHKQIKVLADDAASRLLWGKTQMPFRMPSAASHVRDAPQHWVQLSDWALYSSSCAAQDQLFEEDSYLSHHWPDFDPPSICSSFLCQTTQKVFMQNETHSEKNTLKGFCWAILQFGKSAESLIVRQCCSYENKGSFKSVPLQHCEVWRQTGTKLDLKAAFLLMLFWTGQGFWGGSWILWKAG